MAQKKAKSVDWKWQSTPHEEELPPIAGPSLSLESQLKHLSKTEDGHHEHDEAGGPSRPSQPSHPSQASEPSDPETSEPETSEPESSEPESSHPSKPPHSSKPSRPSHHSRPAQASHPSHPPQPPHPSHPPQPPHPSHPPHPPHPSHPPQPPHPSKPTHPPQPPPHSSKPSRSSHHSRPSRPSRPSGRSRHSRPAHAPHPPRPFHPSNPSHHSTSSDTSSSSSPSHYDPPALPPIAAPTLEVPPPTDANGRKPMPARFDKEGNPIYIVPQSLMLLGILDMLVSLVIAAYCAYLIYKRRRRRSDKNARICTMIIAILGAIADICPILASTKNKKGLLPVWTGTSLLLLLAQAVVTNWYSYPTTAIIAACHCLIRAAIACLAPACPSSNEETTRWQADKGHDRGKYPTPSGGARPTESSSSVIMTQPYPAATGATSGPQPPMYGYALVNYGIPYYGYGYGYGAGYGYGGVAQYYMA